MPKKPKGPQTPEYWEARLTMRWSQGSEKARRMLCNEIAAWCRASAGDIVITYFGEDAPKVECSVETRKRITLVDGEEEALLYMEHQGVKIYHTLNQGCHSENFYDTVRDLSHDNISESSFDVRDLEVPPVSVQKRLGKLWQDDDKIAIAYAIEQGKINLDALV